MGLLLSAPGIGNASQTVTTYSSESHSTSTQSQSSGTITGASSISRSGPGGTVITTHASSHLEPSIEGFPKIDIDGEAFHADLCGKNAVDTGAAETDGSASPAPEIALDLINTSGREILSHDGSVRIGPDAQSHIRIDAKKQLIFEIDGRCLLRLAITRGATTVRFLPYGE